MSEKIPNKCPDCGVEAGFLHEIGCDVERCPECGGQYISCFSCKKETSTRLPWTGEWPGIAECREFGWYAKMVKGLIGWQSCDKSEFGCTHDLNRLYSDAVWDKNQGKFVLSNEVI